jgi:hypothetical protein
VGAEPPTSLASEIARLEVSIDRAAAVTETALAGQSGDDGARQELYRQLAALRERVTLAKQGSEDPQGLRAELATLWFFARTLQGDAEMWRSAAQARAEDLERDRVAARRAQARLAAEREQLALRREALQSMILETAARMAQQNRGECRRTLPVFTLGNGLTVCSVSVSRPRRWFRLAEYWLVTLNRSHDVLVRRE